MQADKDTENEWFEKCEDGYYRYVYLIVNKLNGKLYVGQHRSKRLKDNYLGSGTAIRRAIKKYGKDNFNKGYLEFANSKDHLDELEKKWIKFFKNHPTRGCYNIKDGGHNGKPVPVSEENRVRMSIKFSGENNPFYGKKHTKESRRLISEARKDFRWTEEDKKRMSRQRSGDKHPLYGVGHSEETKKKFRDIHKDRERIECPWCSSVMDRVNAKKYHFDNCDKNPNKKEEEPVSCPWCGTKGRRMSAMVLWHFDNCKQNPNCKKEKITCPHCHRSSYNAAVFRKYHFDNCKNIK